MKYKYFRLNHTIYSTENVRSLYLDGVYIFIYYINDYEQHAYTIFNSVEEAKDAFERTWSILNDKD